MGSRHWVDGRSAKELAKAWFPAPGIACVPTEVEAILSSSPILGNVAFSDAEPEAIVRFDSFGGEPRNCDLLARAQCVAGTVMVSVEAKADEPFGKLIGEEYDRAIARPGSRSPERIRMLASAVLRQSVEQCRDLRYQLLHGAAGALVAATARDSQIAIFLVHEFQTELTRRRNVVRNQSDLDAFVQALSAGRTGTVETGRLYGPWRVRGNKFISPDVDLFIGKAVRNTLGGTAAERT